MIQKKKYFKLHVINLIYIKYLNFQDSTEFINYLYTSL